MGEVDNQPVPGNAPARRQAEEQVVTRGIDLGLAFRGLRRRIAPRERPQEPSNRCDLLIGELALPARHHGARLTLGNDVGHLLVRDLRLNLRIREVRGVDRAHSFAIGAVAG